MLISLSGVSFGYGAQHIFEDMSVQVNPGERIGVVGPNGHGKSTMLRLIAGTLAVERGERSVRRGVEIGYLRQSQEFPADVTVHDLLMATFPEILSLERKLAEIGLRMEAGDTSASTLENYGQLQHRFEELGGYLLEARAEALATEVGFGPEDLQRMAGSLSGGERSRFEIARVLLREPDLLLLDEPTNHLDLVQTERLERRLAEYPKSFLLISHDRTFLRATCNVILEVERRKVVRYAGTYDDYRVQREARLKRALEEYIRQNERVEKTEDFIRRNIAGQKTKQAQSRRKMLEKLERLDRPDDVWEAAGHLGVSFEAGTHPGGKEMARAQGLTIGYEGKPPLFEDFDWTLYRGDRVGIVGRNGAGKTSLVRALLGKIQPRTGVIELGFNVTLGYLDQKLEGMAPDRSLIDEVRRVRPDLAIEQARGELGGFRFFGDDAFKVVAGLSGGERCRLALLKLSLLAHNLLVLDEPTNHLDIPARETLERALAEYDGTLLVISHDRAFLNAVSKKILWVENGTIREFEGNYSEARRRMLGEAAEVRSASSSPRVTPAKAAPIMRSPSPKPNVTVGEPAPAKPNVTAKAPAPARNSENEASPTETSAEREERKRRHREKQKAKSRLEELEKEIATMEARSEELHAELLRDPGGDWERLNRLANEEQELRGRLERRYREWERLGATVDGTGGETRDVGVPPIES